MFYSLSDITNVYNHRHDVKGIFPFEYYGRGPSECCGAVFVEARHSSVYNKGITIWFSEKDESAKHEHFFVESVKLVDGTYMHFKHNLLDKEPEQNEESEEW